jgi:cytochrome c oxidase subunit 4
MSADTQVYHSHKKKYFMIFILLAVLTIAELIAAEAGFSYTLKAASLTILAVGKAFAVAYWYMHLDEEKGWLKFIAAIPISAVIYAVVLILEALSR